MDSDPLHHSIDDAARAGVIRVQADAQPQMISKQLREYDLIRRTQRVVQLRGNCGDNLLCQLAIPFTISNGNHIAEFFGSQLVDQVLLIESADRIVREQAQHHGV